MSDSFYVSRLKFAGAALVAAIPGAGLLFLLQEICGFGGSWTWYVSGFLFYSVLVFANAYIEDDSILFSMQDHRSKLRLLGVHCICLALLFAMIQFASYIQPFLPHSILSGRTKRSSWLEFLFVAALMAVFFVEENWLAVKGKKPSHKRG
jgi:uncharacterized membrane protein